MSVDYVRLGASECRLVSVSKQNISRREMKSIDTFQNRFGTFPQYPETNFLLAENSPNVYY